MDDLYKRITEKLEKLYGPFDADKKRFKKSNNSKIARDLGYSDAQFSRLINGTATPGEYERTLQNVDRILKIKEFEENTQESNSPQFYIIKKKNWIIGTLLFLLLTSSTLLILNLTAKKTNVEDYSRDYTLRWAFETEFVNPYTKLEELPADCNFPCYKLQGQWELNKKYKIPLYIETDGFHYQATSVKMYTRCAINIESDGRLLEGYEYQMHEIWYDKTELDISTFMNNKEGDDGEESNYEALDFTKDSRFVKVATVHTLFRNRFTIGDSITRDGQVIGRDLVYVAQDILKNKLSEEKVNFINKKLNLIARKGLEDFSRPINCLQSPLPGSDFHEVKEGDLMTFTCKLTTNRVPTLYTKAFKFTRQFIKSSCRQSSDKE
ncbi:hypothetical protein C9994_04965 [Marivirga lumbricoides]|uniref:Uncharacterized protein n=1 Tax=Marivirga lumbricoides TaxID=1046115 RepID=A0A2T4DT43_9BACT|nr:hypothetical protein C9994_04965 [Marivirga lumbricoides]